MNLSLQESVLSNEYRDYIIPSTILNIDYITKKIPPNSHFIQLDSLYYLLLTPASGEISLTTFTNYSTIPKLFMLQDQTSLEVSGIIETQTISSLNLTGKGVLIGFMDTGINYQNPVFLDEFGNTRIEAIWDQSIQTGTPPTLFPYGSEYRKSDIQDALNSDFPLDLVPTTDEHGHGTSMASIAAGKSMPTEDFTGAAPEASIAVVKLKEAKPYLKDYFFYSGTEPVFQESDLIMAYLYLISLARSLNLPLIICIGLGSNQGDHTGNMPFEILLNNGNVFISNAVICAGGNEGNRNHHFYYELQENESYKEVEILVSNDTAGFTTELWAQSPELFSVGFVSPGGEIINRIPPTLNSTTEISFVLEETVIEIHYETVQTTSGSQLIFLRFISPTPGVWKIRVFGPRILFGKFHMWLPCYGFVLPDVTFLTPDPYTTITAPGNTNGVITTAVYNAYNNRLYLYSGRGYTRLNDIKPDITAPGVDVSAYSLFPRLSKVSGSSISAAVTAGGTALIIEWGLRQNRSLLFTTTDVKNILIRGAQRDQGTEYPNREWGYGRLNIYQSFTSFINR